MKSLILAAMLAASPSAETPPLAFISLDCTQYGSVEMPFVVMTDGKKQMIGPLINLNKDENAIKFFNHILTIPHEEWVDKACESFATGKEL